MSEFPRCSPVSGGGAAVATSGFSIKRATAKRPAHRPERGADLDISVARFRRGRAHAQCHDATRRVLPHAAELRSCERSIAVSTIDMVSGRHPGERPGRLRDQEAAPRAIAGALLRPFGSGTIRAFPDAHGAELFRRSGTVLMVATGPGGRRRRHVPAAPSPATGYVGTASGQVCLGKLLARDGPQPRQEPPDRMTGSDAVFADIGSMP